MIEGKKVRLRSFELSDLDEIMKHWNNMELSARVDIASPVSQSRFLARWVHDI